MPKFHYLRPRLRPASFEQKKVSDQVSDFFLLKTLSQTWSQLMEFGHNCTHPHMANGITRTMVASHLGANYKKILRLSYDVIITYDNRKSNLR